LIIIIKIHINGYNIVNHTAIQANSESLEFRQEEIDQLLHKLK